MAAGVHKDILIADLERGEELLRLSGHDDEVRSLAFSPDGARLISGGKDGTARVWDVKSGKELYMLRGPAGEAPRVAFSPDGGTVFTASRASFEIRTWDAKEGTLLTKIRAVLGAEAAFALAPHAPVLIFDRLSPRQLIQWDLNTDEKLGNFSTQWDSITALAFSPRGEVLAAAERSGVSGHRVRIWGIAPHPRYTRKEFDNLAGKWKVVESEHAERSGAVRIPSEFMIYRNRVVGFTAGEATLRIDVWRTPKMMDLVSKELAGGFLPMIYDLDGDELRMVIPVMAEGGAGAAARPAGFDDGESQILVVAKRAEDEGDSADEAERSD